MPYNVWVTHVTNGLKPLHVIRLNLTFHDSPLKEGYILSNDFYASTLTICLRTPLSTLLSLCHLILFVVCLNVNSFCNFGLRWKSCKVLCRIFLPLPILILYQSSLVITYKHGWNFVYRRSTTWNRQTKIWWSYFSENFGLFFYRFFGPINTWSKPQDCASVGTRTAQTQKQVWTYLGQPSN